MDSDWSIHPGIGLGRLKFGMTPEDVKALEGIYGKVAHEWISSPPSEADLKRTEKFLACLSPEERAVEIEENRIENKIKSNEMGHRMGEIHGVDLKYYDRRLYSITPYLPCEMLNLDGLPVYGSDTEAVVLALAKRLQENPLLDGDSLEFRKSLVELYAFTRGVNKSGEPRYYTLDKEMKKKNSDFHYRHIRLQTLPHDIPFEDWDKIAANWSRYEEIKLL